MPSVTKKEEIQNNQDTNAISEMEKKLEQKIKEIEEKSKKLDELLNKAESNSNISNDISTSYNPDSEIHPNKKTKITSLTYGALSLHHPSRGFLRFKNYGDTHSLSYAQLSEYMNTCREAAMRGKFYIHDQRMVDDFGLSEVYEKLLSKDIVDNILSGNDFDFKGILENCTQEQKESFAEMFTMKVYNGEFHDLNKVEIISKATGIDIMSKVQDSQKMAEFVGK